MIQPYVDIWSDERGGFVRTPIIERRGQKLIPCGDCKRPGTFLKLDVPAQNSILITGGIGDALTLEGMLAPEERDTLTTIYYACPAAREIKTIFAALPNYPRLKTHTILPSRGKVHYEKANVEADHGKVLAADWSILKIFPQRKPYQGSSVLAFTMAQPLPLARPYAVIVSASRGFGRWTDRDFSEADWQTCLEWLAAKNLRGVVLGAETLPIPASNRLQDLRRQTSVLQGIEILKTATAYLGIDSWLSVLAAKLFPPCRLAIKSTWDHCYQWASLYYAPRREFPFLQRQLVAPEAPEE